MKIITPMKIFIVTTMAALTWMFGSVSMTVLNNNKSEAIRKMEEGRLTAQEPPAQNIEMIFPDETWKRATPEQVGWSSEKLDAAKEYFEQLNADACVVVVNGRMLASWGDEAKPIDNRSMRKFQLLSLFGVHSKKVDVTRTLRDMNIDDKIPLTDQEKTATLANLLSSSSGVYVPAAFEAPSMAKNRPARGAYPPGKAFYYNNWDFNALSTIFEKETGEKLFESYQRDIVQKLQMQDYKPEHGVYQYEKESVHPAYRFETSAQDDARLGHLWLNNGQWKGEQVIPKQWIDSTLTSKFEFTNPNRFAIRDGYGYLTWIDLDKEGKLIGYSALGNSGQFLYISVKHNAVIALRADPGSIFKKWFGLRLDPSESYRLIDFILAAH